MRVPVETSRRPARPPLVHHDPLSGRLVFVAPQRAERPNDADLSGPDTADPAAWCPFCAGNEDRTPPAVLQAPADASSPWRARIVPNRYPVVTDDRKPDTSAAAAVRPARGVHDVVVESARHDATILALEPASWRDVWRLCHARLGMIAARRDLAWATVFKNSGPRAGASLEHVHSQLVALDFVPPVIGAELAAAEAEPAGFARLLDEAHRTGRVVAEAGGLVALVPPAPRQPFETWILPTHAASFFHDAAPADVAAIADLTRSFVERLDRLVPGADYNWWLHQTPFVAPVATWHWHLEILPRLASFAGFELGTGCHISTLAPEDAAAMLRDG